MLVKLIPGCQYDDAFEGVFDRLKNVVPHQLSITRLDSLVYYFSYVILLKQKRYLFDKNDQK